MDALLKLGFSSPAAVRSPSYNILKTLPERPEGFDARPCHYKENFSFLDIEQILLKMIIRLLMLFLGTKMDF